VALRGDGGQGGRFSRSAGGTARSSEAVTTGHTDENDAVRGAPPSPPGGVAFQPTGSAPGRSKIEESNDSAMAGAVRLGSPRYGYTFRRVLLAADVLGLAAAILGINAVFGQESHGIIGLAGPGGFSSGPLLVLFGSVPVWIALAHAVGLYHLAERRVDHTFADELGPVFFVTTVWLWLDLLLSAAILPGSIGLKAPAALWIAVTVAVLVARAAARRIARDRAWYRRPVVLIGDRGGTDRILSRVLRHPEWGLDVVSRLRVDGERVELDSFDGADVKHSETIEGRPGDGFASRIASVADGLGVDRVILTGASASLSERTHLARLLTEHGLRVDYVYGEPETLYAAAVLHSLEGLPVLSVQPTRLSGGSAAMKRGLDLAVSTAALVLLSPLFAIVAMRIKLDSPGPVIFRQPRVGRDGKPFDAVKFRTMVDGADAMRADVRKESIHANGQGLLKLRDDPRTTRFGAKLRRWSIDELPQLWNVLRGDMSLVGPRPLPLDEAPLVRGYFEMRTRVRPGMTGTWQTHGRSDIPLEDMLKLDYTYVAGWSLREDLRLLLRTAAVVARGRGSY
jgi:exopolysaccharide biosynthesis polyprenyl glycosylphosphotransferase